MLTTGTGASGEMRVTSPQMNSSSITSPSTTMRQSRARSRISWARFLVRLSKMKIARFSIECGLPKYSIDGAHDALKRHAQDALRRFELGAEISVTWLAGHLFVNDFVWPGRPRPQMHDV